LRKNVGAWGGPGPPPNPPCRFTLALPCQDPPTLPLYLDYQVILSFLKNDDAYLEEPNKISRFLNKMEIKSEREGNRESLRE